MELIMFGWDEETKQFKLEKIGEKSGTRTKNN
jgi:hypothetical protein